MTQILGLWSGCIWFQHLGAAQVSVQNMRPAVLKSPFFTVAPNDLRLYGEWYEKIISFQCCRFNQTYQGIQITLAYNISVSPLFNQGQSHPGCLTTLHARQGAPCM